MFQSTKSVYWADFCCGTFLLWDIFVVGYFCCAVTFSHVFNFKNGDPLGRHTYERERKLCNKKFQRRWDIKLSLRNKRTAWKQTKSAKKQQLGRLSLLCSFLLHSLFFFSFLVAHFFCHAVLFFSGGGSSHSDLYLHLNGASRTLHITTELIKQDAQKQQVTTYNIVNIIQNKFRQRSPSRKCHWLL